MTIKYKFPSRLGKLFAQYDQFYATNHGNKRPDPDCKTLLDIIQETPGRVYVVQTEEERKQREIQYYYKMTGQASTHKDELDPIYLLPHEKLVLLEDMMTRLHGFGYAKPEGYTADELYESLVGHIISLTQDVRFCGKVGTYVMQFDKSAYVNPMKMLTQADRIRKQKEEPYDNRMILSSNGLVSKDQLANRPDEEEEHTAELIQMGRLMGNRDLRVQLYRFFLSKLKTDKRIHPIQLILDFEEKTGPTILYKGVCAEKPELIHYQGEADLGVVQWLGRFTKQGRPCMIVGTDKDLYFTVLLNIHRFNQRIYINIRNPVRQDYQFCDMNMLSQWIYVRTGFMEAFLFMIMFQGTDFFFKNWVFGSSNEEAMEAALMKDFATYTNEVSPGQSLPANVPLAHCLRTGQNPLRSPVHFQRILTKIETEHDPGKYRCKRAQLVTDKEQINWAYTQIMNHWYYWASLDGVRPIDSHLIRPDTKDILSQWAPHFKCGMLDETIPRPTAYPCATPNKVLMDLRLARDFRKKVASQSRPLMDTSTPPPLERSEESLYIHHYQLYSTSSSSSSSPSSSGSQNKRKYKQEPIEEEETVQESNKKMDSNILSTVSIRAKDCQLDEEIDLVPVIHSKKQKMIPVKKEKIRLVRNEYVNEGDEDEETQRWNQTRESEVFDMSSVSTKLKQKGSLFTTMKSHSVREEEDE